jgi:hypothetical protein
VHAIRKVDAVFQSPVRQEEEKKKKKGEIVKMPSDIRSFFGPKGGGAPKPAPRKAEELAKSKRTSKPKKMLLSEL